MPPKNRFSWLLALFAIAIATLFLSRAIHTSLLVDDDSFTYLEASKNIAAGKGYVFSIPPDPVAPVTHFPPLHPAGLAVFHSFTTDDLQAACWWNIFCLGIECGLVFWIISMATGGQQWLAFGGTLLFGLHPQVLEVHAGILSEPLFLVLLLGILAGLLRYGTEENIGWLVGASLLAGLAGLARYSGVIHVVLIPLTFVLVTTGSWQRRLLRGILSGTFVILPLVVWSLRNVAGSGAATDRSLHYHLIGAAHFREAALTLSSWVMPWRFVSFGTGLLIAFLLFALLAGLAWAFLADSRRSSTVRTPWAIFACFSFLYLLGYLGHLVAAISLLHYNTPLDARLLLPALTLFLLSVAILPHLATRKLWLVALTLVCGGILALNLIRSRAWANDPRRPERGFRGSEWTNNPAIAFLRELPPETAIWTNARGPLYAQLRRPVRGIPPKRNWSTTELIPNAEASLTQIADSAAQQRAIVVYVPPNRPSVDFSVGDGSPAGIGHFQDFTLAELQTHLPLHQVAEGRSIQIFQVGN